MNEAKNVKEIERIIRKLVASLLHFGAEAGWTEVVAAEIGKLREADKEQLRICQNGLQRSGEELYGLLAQLAEMQQALEGMLELYDSERRDFKSTNAEIDAWIEYCEMTKARAEKAASAAPVEVLWAGEGTVNYEHPFEDDPSVMVTELAFHELPPGWLLNAKDGEQVKVIVTKPVNQKQLTIESKAKMVDKEGNDEKPKR